MSKVIGYKGIIRNMVEVHIFNFIEERAHKWPTVEDIQLTLNEEIGVPQFEAKVAVGRWNYLLSGFISEVGTVNISLALYTRTVCNRKEDGEWDMNSARPVTRMKTGDELNAFKFNE